MNDKQKVIIDTIVQMEYALNDLIRDALQEGVIVQGSWHPELPRPLHISVNSSPTVFLVPNDE